MIYIKIIFALIAACFYFVMNYIGGTDTKPTEVFAVKDIEACEIISNNKNLNIDCSKLYQQAMDTHDDSLWEFPDKESCTNYYGEDSCIKHPGNETYYLSANGFMFSFKNGLNATPIYFTKKYGYLAPNSFPLKLGVNDFGYNKRYIKRLSTPRKLDQVICYYRKRSGEILINSSKLKSKKSECLKIKEILDSGKNINKRFIWERAGMSNIVNKDNKESEKYKVILLKNGKPQHN